MALPEIVGILRKSRHRRPLGVEPRLQRQHVLQFCPTVPSDTSKRKIADVHPVDDKRTRNAQDRSRIIGAEFLILGEDRDALATEKMTQRGLEQDRGPRRQPHDPILAGLASNPDLELVALAQLGKRLRFLPVAVRQFDESQHMSGHGRALSGPKWIDER